MKLPISNWLQSTFDEKNNCENCKLLDGIYVPENFRKKVLRHFLLNYASNINGINPSLFLAIQGCKGEGKTFMTDAVCRYYNINSIFISGSELCGRNEGDSILKIKSQYEAACIRAASDGCLSAIVIDDFHLSIASNFKDNVSSTTNAQVLIGYLMNLADNPYIHKNRIPVILIGNDFTGLHAPLTRSGRMDFYEWSPNIDDKVLMIYFLFKKFYNKVDFNDIKKLVNKYPNMHVAFFKSVLQDLFFSQFDAIIDQFDQIRGSCNLSKVNALIAQNLFVSPNFDVCTLSEFAERRISNNGKKYER